ncbi:MAG: DUF1398 family protein [Polyangiaceae bacterium]
MDPIVERVIEDAVAASHAGARPFADIVGSLVAHGVESYRVDYRQRSSTYFLPTGEWRTVPNAAPDIPIAEGFDQEAIVAAIRGSQRGEVKYPEFIERSMRAGCVGYIVWLSGRHVSYFGRLGETHVERFPSRTS